MTVIFHTNARYRVLAGDMLLSVPGPLTSTELRLPSQPNGIIIPSDFVPDYIPVRMRRKIFIINERLAVGAAGKVSHIVRFVNDLIMAFGNRVSFTYDEITRFCQWRRQGGPLGRSKTVPPGVIGQHKCPRQLARINVT